MKKKIKSNELFYIQHINDSELSDNELLDFCVKQPEGYGLVRYLQSGLAEVEEERFMARTYIVRDNISDELVGYFSLKAGMVSLNERKINDNETLFSTRPGIELSNFALTHAYIKNHNELKGCGLTIFTDFIRPIALETSELIGVKDLYIFALPLDNLQRQYIEKYGFVRLDKESEEQLHKRLKPAYDKSCIFMFQTLHREKETQI